MAEHRSALRRAAALRAVAALVLVSGALTLAGCGETDSRGRGIQTEYDSQTGRLKLLKYDSDGDGKIDTWSYMEGNRVLRIEIDQNRDGKVDRWEHYGPDRRLEKVGFSRADDGKEGDGLLVAAAGHGDV